MYLGTKTYGYITCTYVHHNLVTLIYFIVVVNYVHDVKWRRISASHIQFNCTLACRSFIRACVVQLNGTTNTSSGITKNNFSSWAIVDFYSVNANKTFTYTAFARGNNNILGLIVNGSIPPVSICISCK